MSIQKALLFNFREELNSQSTNSNLVAEYDIDMGLWLNKERVPFIKQIINSNGAELETTKTATREGIDQSEVTNYCDQTLITKSREGVDQSEVSNSFDSPTGITRSRESADQSENSFSIFNGTRLTDSREGADQSEVSNN